jgi:hypothetical protein
VVGEQVMVNVEVNESVVEFGEFGLRFELGRNLHYLSLDFE